MQWPGGLASDVKNLERTWFEWETEYSVFPKTVRIDVRSAAASNKISAHTTGRTLHFGPQALREEGIRNHELAHAFLTTYCPAFEGEKFLQETFAYQVSGDYRRVAASDKKFYYASISAIYLNDNRSNLDKVEDVAPALSRLLGEKPEKEWKVFWKDFFRSCSSGETAAWKEKVLTNLTIPSVTAAGDEGFLLVDAVSGLPIVEKGNLNQLRPTGSLLKPLLMSGSEKLRESRSSRQDPSWACQKNQEPGSRLWSWPEALAHSCNGFFLDAKLGQLDLKPALQKIFEVSDRQLPPNLRLEHVIGLVPGLELSTREIAGLYLDLQKNHRDIMEALLETSKNGTLSGLPDSPWFEKNNIALKSGTARDSLNRPVIGWIAAVTPTWIAVHFKVGRSPPEMLGGMRDLLKNFAGLKAEPSEVQILGLVPENRVELRCRKLDSSEVASELLEGEVFHCPNNSILARYPMNDGSLVERNYFGEIRKSAFNLNPELTKNTTARRARARSGSSLILKTSRLSYTLEVLASEYPQGRIETLKALAYAIQSNAASDRHGDRPVCDTTHCQVYQGNWANLDLSGRTRILEAVLAVEHENPDRKGWVPFAIGGNDHWKQNRTLEQVKGLLTAKEEKTLLSKRLGNRCEYFRNQLSLPSCPKKIAIKGSEIVFEGRGEGHGQGVDLTAADALAAQGYGYREILKKQITK